ncbi:hypothetical protein BV355_04564 [Pseudomonas syringae pv. actinidiae]|nr:hypothetical protein BV344_05261 [Pseudomonas syringae pv. actinidiae]OSN97477.1 hypothetical protein BV355_04564 [Pseudomonas syringae pv. actinidiae]
MIFITPLQVISQHVQTHFGTHSAKPTRQKVRCTHPLLESPEGVLHGLLAQGHYLRRVGQADLHFF